MYLYVTKRITSDTHTHTKEVNPTLQPPRSGITQKINEMKLNKKILYYSVLKSSWDKLQEYVLKNGGFN